jgi:hypothetical protein
MSDDIELKPTQRYALLLLMAEAREVTNTYLVGRKLYLKAKEHRKPMEDAGLIKVRRNPLSIELTEKGWSRAKAEFALSAPPRGGAPGAALYTILGKIGQFLERSDIAAADFFTTPEEIEVAVDLESLIRKVYGEVAPKAGAWVMLDRIRGALGSVSRQEVDAALIRLYRAPDVQIVPETNQKVLTAAERAAAVSIGNQDKHLIAIGV